jgi:hypothetical protein
MQSATHPAVTEVPLEDTIHPMVTHSLNGKVRPRLAARSLFEFSILTILCAGMFYQSHDFVFNYPTFIDNASQSDQKGEALAHPILAEIHTSCSNGPPCAVLDTWRGT